MVVITEGEAKRWCYWPQNFDNGAQCTLTEELTPCGLRSIVLWHTFHVSYALPAGADNSADFAAETAENTLFNSSHSLIILVLLTE